MLATLSTCSMVSHMAFIALTFHACYLLIWFVWSSTCTYNVPQQCTHKHSQLYTHTYLHTCRLVWSRIWAVLSDFFVTVGCHSNLAVAMYAVSAPL